MILPIFLVVVAITISSVLPSPIVAQTIIKGTLHRFDTTSKDWADPHETHWIFKDDSGSIDSVLRLTTVSPTSSSLERFYDWHRATNEIDLRTLDGFDRRFRQPGFQNQIASSRDWFVIELKDTFLVEQKSISLSDSHVVAQRQRVLGPDGFVKLDSFFRDAYGRIHMHRSITAGAHYNEDRQIEKEWIRDSLGRVVKTIDRVGQLTTDSIIYEYGADNILSVMTHIRLLNPSITKHEYSGWRTYRSEIATFAPGPAVGGDGFLSRSTYTWDNDSLAFRLYAVTAKEFDEVDRVIREAWIYYEIDSVIREILAYDTVTFYDSGDLNTRSHWNSRYNTLFVDQYLNTYDLNGNLVLSDFHSHGMPLRRVAYQQLTASVRHLVNNEEDLPTIGKSLELVSGQHVRAYNLLGIEIINTNSTGDQFEFNLPSGLYFISIDGGKPRKHLIP